MILGSNLWVSHQIECRISQDRDGRRQRVAVSVPWGRGTDRPAASVGAPERGKLCAYRPFTTSDLLGQRGLTERLL